MKEKDPGYAGAVVAAGLVGACAAGFTGVPAAVDVWGSDLIFRATVGYLVYLVVCRVITDAWSAYNGQTPWSNLEEAQRELDAALRALARARVQLAALRARIDELERGHDDEEDAGGSAAAQGDV